MLSPEYLKAIPNELIKVYQEIEDEILLDIARRIARKDEAGYTSTYQLKQLLIGNKDFEELKKKLKPMLYHSDEVLDEIIENGIKTHYNDEQSIYSMVGKSLVNLDKNKAVLSQIQAYKKAMKENLNNLTKTMGVAVNDDFVNLNTLYKHELNKAVLSTQLGVLDSTTAIRRVVNNIARGGVKFINYEGSGRNYTIESAVGMVVRSGLNRLSGEISLLNAEEMEQDLMEISAHLGARPSHSVWQGEIVSLSGRAGYLDLQDIGYGETTGFQGVNCRHNWYPYFEGLSYRSYSKEYLQELEDKKVYYEGEEYTYYEATQIQRQLERDVRNLKKRVMMYDTVGDKEMHAIQSFKLKNKRDEYYKFSESIGINKRLENLGKFGYTKSVSGRSSYISRQNPQEYFINSKLAKFRIVEPDITNTLKDISKDIDGKLVGLEFKFKSKESLMRKTSAGAKELNIEFHEALNKVNDILRYTIVHNENGFTQSFFKSKKLLEEKGFEFIRVKNTFKENQVYKGINTLVRDKKGNVFELQYHTPKSIEIKEGALHKLYEKQRLLNPVKDKELYKKLTDEMVSLSDMIDIPKGIERIK